MRWHMVMGENLKQGQRKGWVFFFLFKGVVFRCESLNVYKEQIMKVDLMNKVTIYK